MRWEKWNKDEENVIDMWIAGRLTPAMAVQLLPARTADAVRRKRDEMKIAAEAEDEVYPGRRRRQSDDQAFQAAMRMAIKAGLESAPIGVVKTPDHEEFRPTTFLPGVRSSGCSSSAQLCVDLAPAETLR